MKKVIFLPLFLLVVLSAFVFLYGRLSYLSGEDTKTPSPASFALLPYKEQAEIIKNVSGDSPTKAWVYLKQSYREEGGPSVEDTTWPGYSHTLGHIVGHSFYNRYGIESLSFCDTSLGFACMHGVVEELIVQKGIEGARECSLGGGVIEQCNHGLGHGFLIREAYDVREALHDCDEFVLPDAESRSNCYDGVFMEYVWSGPQYEIDAKDIFTFCGGFEDRLQSTTCVRYVPLVLRKMFGSDFEKVAAECLRAPDPAFREICERNTGTVEAVLQKGNFEKIQEACSSIEDEEYTYRCFMHAAIETHRQQYRGWRDSVAALCGEASPYARDNADDFCSQFKN